MLDPDTEVGNPSIDRYLIRFNFNTHCWIIILPVAAGTGGLISCHGFAHSSISEVYGGIQLYRRRQKFLSWWTHSHIFI